MVKTNLDWVKKNIIRPRHEGKSPNLGDSMEKMTLFIFGKWLRYCRVVSVLGCIRI